MCQQTIRMPWVTGLQVYMSATGGTGMEEKYECHQSEKGLQFTGPLGLCQQLERSERVHELTEIGKI